jgi:hypothetical protein
MILTFIEYLYLFLGLWCLITGTLPSFLKKNERINYNKLWIRLFGLVLMLVYPISFLACFFATIFFGQQIVAYYTVIDTFIIAIFTWIAYLVFMKINQKSYWLKYQSYPQKAQNIILDQIERQTKNALIYAIIGIFGIVTVIVSPLSIVFSTQALKMIEEHQTGEKFMQKAKTARLISILTLIFYAVVILVFIWIIVSK